MKRIRTLNINVIASLLLCACALTACQNDATSGKNGDKNKVLIMLKDPDLVDVVYPKTLSTDVSDVFFGTTVTDPYRWLEGGDSSHAADVETWIAEQSIVADNYLKAIPLRKPIEKRLRQLWNFERFGAPFKEGDFYYYYHNSGMQNQSVLYQQKDINSAGTVFIDPNKFSEDGTVALNGVFFSKDGKYAAYMTSAGGSDWRTAQVMEVATQKMLSDKLEWIRYSGISWYGDGFYYSRFPEPDKGVDIYTVKNEFHEVYYHKLGTPQSADQLIYADRQNPDYMVGVSVSEDQQFLFLSISESTSGNALYFKRLQQENSEFEPIVTDFNHDFSILDNDGDKLFIYTNDAAPNYRLIEVDAKLPQRAKWRNIVATDANRVLEGINTAGNYFVAQYIKDACNQLELYDKAGKMVQRISLPDSIGNVTELIADKKSTDLFFGFTSFTYPNTIFKFDLNTKKSTAWKTPKVDFNPEDYETKQVFYPSKDGTKIPMFITHKKGLKLDGSNPTLLYGYGGFNISILPSFSVERVPFIENGGVYVVANIRGGGEYGAKWHDGGRLANKQNVFDDFIAAAEYLIAQKYTSKIKLAIEGRSNGGLLIGACMTQRPDLFKVAVPIVGVLDMLRYQHFGVGEAWAYDYGLSSDSSQFANLIKFSPLHNVRKNNYPATLVMTAEFDDRVVPAHSFKFGAALQTNQASKHPVLIRIDRKAGHGAGKPTEKLIEEAADKLSFILFNLGIK
jgi:prolyl oligopeptidase